MAILNPIGLSIRSRRSVLVSGALIAGGVLAAAVDVSSASAQVKKTTQSAAKYQPTPKGSDRCEDCVLFEKPASCQTVEGEISPNGWCALFAGI